MKYSKALFGFLVFVLYRNFGECDDEAEENDSTKVADPAADPVPAPESNLTGEEPKPEKLVEFLTQESAGETQPESLGSNLLVLDLNERRDTMYTTYTVNGSLETYTARDPYFFHKLKRGETDVWECNLKKHPYKVQVRTRNNASRELKLFCVKPKEKPWEPEPVEPQKKMVQETVTADELEQAMKRARSQ